MWTLHYKFPLQSNSSNVCCLCWYESLLLCIMTSMTMVTFKQLSYSYSATSSIPGRICISLMIRPLKGQRIESTWTSFFRNTSRRMSSLTSDSYKISPHCAAVTTSEVKCDTILGGTATTAVNKNPLPDFSTNAVAFQNKSTMELIRAGLTFGLCTVTPIVQNAEVLIRYSYRTFGPFITDHILRHTLYSIFCSGPDLSGLLTGPSNSIQDLHRANIGCIFDYAAEDDDCHDTTKVDATTTATTTTSHDDINAVVDLKYDRNMEHITQSIRHAASLLSSSSSSSSSVARVDRNFVAIKITGLGDATVLARMSCAIRKLRRQLDASNIDVDIIDVIIHPTKYPAVADSIPDVILSSKDVATFQRIYSRCIQLAEIAKENDTRLLFDAEQVRYQPAIDVLVLHLQRTFNGMTTSNHPMIYNTYQCYLKDSLQRLQCDIESSKRYHYHVGIKLVRGAYMESERSYAKKLCIPSPIQDTLNDTHNNYNMAIQFVLHHAVQQQQHNGPCIELMCATHNQRSIEYAIQTMNALNIDRESHRISFAQLFGMKDNLTYNLAQYGFTAYKYVPYGDIRMLTPYLIRRANENSAIRDGTNEELQMIVKELLSRFHVYMTNTRR